VDVGCYDGWLLCQLEDLPFAKMIGVEPRTKNIKKGKFIRKTLKIKTRCEFKKGEIENLKKTLAGIKPDIVICCGLIHHLPSTASGIKNLHQICGELLFLETICLPFNEKLHKYKKIFELKDIPYKVGKSDYGFSGHKLESAAYDGSATQYSVVSIPSVGAIRMFLSAQGFSDIRMSADPDRYSKIFKKSHRKFSAVCFLAKKTVPTDESKMIMLHESGLLLNQLSFNKVRKIKTALLQNKSTFSEKMIKQLQSRLAKNSKNKFMLEIAKSIPFAPMDKILLELGKGLFFKGLYKEAIQELLSITRKLNADWRCVYRAFCILAWSYKAIGAKKLSLKYKRKCLIAYPSFPTLLLNRCSKSTAK